MPLLVNTLVEKSIASMIGLVLLGAGVPARHWWRRNFKRSYEAWLES
jgi:hypothetical protein